MTQFEYLAIAFSLLYSLAALRIIGGLSEAFETETRSLPHLALSLVHLFLVAVSFWVFWSLRDADWTFIGFLVALLIPGALYYCSTVLIPAEPESVASWRDHHLEVRNRWYLGLALWAVGAALSATVNLGMGLAHPARGIHALALAVGLAGGLSRSERVHRGLVALLVVLSVVTVAAQLRPDWLAGG